MNNIDGEMRRGMQQQSGREGAPSINIGLMRLAAPSRRSKKRLLWDGAPYMRSRAK